MRAKKDTEQNPECGQFYKKQGESEHSDQSILIAMYIGEQYINADKSSRDRESQHAHGRQQKEEPGILLFIYITVETGQRNILIDTFYFNQAIITQ